MDNDNHNPPNNNHLTSKLRVKIVMTDHLLQRFPNQIKELRAIILENNDFAELCSDYEEMCTWMAVRCHEIDQHRQECEQALQILKELEEEILRIMMDRRT